MDNVKKIKEYLKSNGYSAIIIPSNDPHFSECPADFFKCREFVSGFDGSAGCVVITQKQALLWVDSRYWLQAEKQVDSSVFEVIKVGMVDLSVVLKWIETNLKSGSIIAIDGKLLSCSSYDMLSNNLVNTKLTTVNDPFAEIWEKRPLLPLSAISTLGVEYSGEDALSKISKVRNALSLEDKDVYYITSLDEIAWLYNIRANDVTFNPVALSYAAIDKDFAYLFIDKEKLNDCCGRYFDELNIKVVSYHDFDDFIAGKRYKKVVYDANKFDVFHYDLALNSGAKLVNSRYENGIITSLKSVKNRVEIDGFKKAMINDGIALVKFMMWLENSLKSSDKLTEYGIGLKLQEFRKSSPFYVEDSFAAIVAYGANGASAHYTAKESGSSEVVSDGFLLIDSGGQYVYGTTDITRTIHLSTPTLQQKIDYTVVLQGMIELSSAIFPINYRGELLDILARNYLLKESLNYGHGTGHGVGHFLNVHEGPQSIRPSYNPEVLKCGMVTSNEPAIYRNGEYGIRIENMMTIVEHSKSDFGEFLAFETLTLCPIDLKPIIVERLTTAQRRWLNQYHANVYDALSPFLDVEHNHFLSSKTKAI